LKKQNGLFMARKLGTAALLILAICVGMWFWLWTPGSKEESARPEVKAPVMKRIEMVSFIKGGGIAGVQEGWVIREGTSPVPDPRAGIEDLKVEVIPGEKVSGPVKTMMDLDRSHQGRGSVADAFEYQFVVSFEDGTQIKAWRQDWEGGEDLQRFIETAGKIREVVLKEGQQTSSVPAGNVLPDLAIQGVWFVHVPSQGKMREGYQGWEVALGQARGQWSGTGVSVLSRQTIEREPVEAGLRQVMALIKAVNVPERPADAGFYQLKVLLANGVSIEIVYGEGHPMGAQIQECIERMKNKVMEGNDGAEVAQEAK
jgi:hypothetical protein